MIRKLEATGMLILVFLLSSTMVRAAGTPPDYKRVAERVSAILIEQEATFTPEIKSYVPDSFCENIYDALKRTGDIKYIEPIEQSDSYEAPNIQKWLGGCKEKSPIKLVTFEPRIFSSLGDIPKDQRESFGKVYFLTKNFRLFRTNIDNDLAGEMEFVLYGDTMVKKGRTVSRSNFGMISILNAKNCDSMGKIQVEQPYDFVSDEPMENYSGIITYANYNYIYQLRKYRSTHQSHSLMIHQWHQKYKKPQAMCFIHKPIQKLRN